MIVCLIARVCLGERVFVWLLSAMVAVVAVNRMSFKIGILRNPDIYAHSYSFKYYAIQRVSD